MRLSKNKVDNLHTIDEIESKKVSTVIELPLEELGNSLIDVYYSTTNLDARKLITDFMNEAGVEWMRKLLTRDTSPVKSSKTRVASVYAFTSLEAANDDVLSISYSLDLNGRVIF